MDSLFYELPALEPPPGLTTNFDNPSSTLSSLVAALAIMVSVATIVLAARVYTRFYIMKMHQLEDCK